MREDQLELIEKSFPKGAVIFHVLPNEECELLCNNPDDSQMLKLVSLLLRHMMLNDRFLDGIMDLINESNLN